MCHEGRDSVRLVWGKPDTSWRLLEEEVTDATLGGLGGLEDREDRPVSRRDRKQE